MLPLSTIAWKARLCRVSMRLSRVGLRDARIRLFELQAKFGLQDFAIVALGQRLQENVSLGSLETRDILKTKPVQFSLVHRRIGARHHASDDFLAPLGTLAADDGGFFHSRMKQQDLFDLARIDVCAA